jgi:hypothetical protein
VGTLISTIQAALSVAQSTLVFKHLRRLAFVLATPGDQEEEACRLLEEIVSVATEVMKQQKVDNSQYIEVMRVATYIKSICTRLGEQARYKDAVMSTHFLEALIEAYLQKNVGRSATFTVEFLGFLGSQLQEFPELYFKALSGVNLDPVLK